ncbi:hypothetical protein DW068_15575 [Anaerobutyricum hallii]|uniref:Uncharacterized protein n=1 Tax=Anaerobutyricum hallii TaxID=39488 RepID=A0A415G3B5_9FIRM|nr:hypothetical protein DW068_15575 [Anaerobutyricum hallii]
MYFFFWRNLIHKKCPLSDKQFYFFNCLPKREHTIISYICDFSRCVLNIRFIRSYPTLAPRPQI